MPIAIVERGVKIFASPKRLLTNTFHCCIQTFRAIGNFDRLVGVQFCKTGLATGSETTAEAFWGSYRNGSGGARISPLSLYQS
jgi:hypothetical protein